MASREVILLLRKAQQGDVQAQVDMGKRYLEGGAGLRCDHDSAFYWLRKAAARGHPEAQKLIGSAIPESSVEEPETVATYYRSASERGSANASVALSDWMLTGRISDAEEARAFEILRGAAEAGDRKAQLRLGFLLRSGATGEERRVEGLRWLEKAAEQGSRAAAIALCDWYWERNDPLGRRWMEKIRPAREAEHAYRMAVMLLGEGSAREASALFAKAAEEEHPAAQLSFGLLHAAACRKSESGVPHSLKRAAYWLEKASRNGCAQASLELYHLFRRREFSLRNIAMSEKYLETAARQGQAHAQFLAGIACLQLDTPRDADVAAANWLVQAAGQGHAEAAALIDVLYPRPIPASEELTQERMRIVRLMARSRIALAVRLELAHAFGLNVQELLMFDPALAEHETCLLIDGRRLNRRLKRRILVIETEAERALLARARRLLDARNPHPSDVRGPHLQRRLDLHAALNLLGGRMEVFETSRPADEGTRQPEPAPKSHDSHFPQRKANKERRVLA